MHNTDKMKVSELQKIIRTAINEAVNEADISPAEQAAKQAEITAITKQIQALQAKKNDLASGRTPVVAENEIDEMANVAVRYELNPDAAAADFAGKKSRIVAAMQATEEPMSKIDVASALGYDKQNPINKDFMELVAAGTIIPSGEQKAPRLTRPAAEPTAAAATNDYGIEGGIEGDMSDEEVDAMFAKIMRGDDEEEPEAGEIEKTSVSGTQMSDDEFNAWMDYQELQRRLANTKSNILKARKSRATPGDIQDRPSDEVERLRALKKKLEDKIAGIVSKFPSVAKDAGEAPEIENPEEEPIDEWAVNRAQYYAGIKK